MVGCPSAFIILPSSFCLHNSIPNPDTCHSSFFLTAPIFTARIIRSVIVVNSEFTTKFSATDFCQCYLLDCCPSGCEHRITVPAGIDLYKEGELATRVYWLYEGCVAISRKNDCGSSVIANIAEQGEFLGVDSLAVDSFYPATATALQPTSFCSIPRFQIIQALETDHRVLTQLLKGLCVRLNRAELSLRSW